MSDPLSHGAGGDAAETAPTGPAGEAATGEALAGEALAGGAVAAGGGATGDTVGSVVAGADGPGGDVAAAAGVTADESAAAAAADGVDALTITGRVRDSLGVALPRALVTLTGPDGGRRLAKTRSADDGAFSLAAPGEGDYLLAAFSPQLGTVRVAVQLTGRPVEVEFRIDVPGSATP